jgi:hypothetical protein
VSWAIVENQRLEKEELENPQKLEMTIIITRKLSTGQKRKRSVIF